MLGARPEVLAAPSPADARPAHRGSRTPTDRPTKMSGAKRWACSKCTFMNSWGKTTCEMCNEGERPSAPEVVEEGVNWGEALLPALRPATLPLPRVPSGRPRGKFGGRPPFGRPARQPSPSWIRSQPCFDAPRFAASAHSRQAKQPAAGRTRLERAVRPSAALRPAPRRSQSLWH